jgi:hypothetical protein
LYGKRQYEKFEYVSSNKTRLLLAIISHEPSRDKLELIEVLNVDQ